MTTGCGPLRARCAKASPEPAGIRPRRAPPVLAALFSVALALAFFFHPAPALPQPDGDTAFRAALITGARSETERMPFYKSAYYRGGYPPEEEGVCTDLVWRAFRDAGVDLKSLVDADIRANTGRYPRVNGKPDPHIDFRRVPNLTVFFRRHAEALDTRFQENDPASHAIWQPGDLVVFQGPDHIAFLSDRLNARGFPLLLHNQGPWASEGDDFAFWYGRGIVAHFRLSAKSFLPPSR